MTCLTHSSSSSSSSQTTDPANTVYTTDPGNTVYTTEPANTVYTTDPGNTVYTTDPGNTVYTSVTSQPNAFSFWDVSYSTSTVYHCWQVSYSYPLVYLSHCTIFVFTNYFYTQGPCILWITLFSFLYSTLFLIRKTAIFTIFSSSVHDIVYIHQFVLVVLLFYYSMQSSKFTTSFTSHLVFSLNI